METILELSDLDKLEKEVKEDLHVYSNYAIRIWQPEVEEFQVVGVLDDYDVAYAAASRYVKLNIKVQVIGLISGKVYFEK